MALHRDQAIVLRTHKLGEADRVVVLYGLAGGKRRGVAKGVRKTTSRFGARLEPTGHVAVQLYEGRGELETITQAESIDQFPTLRTDLDRLARAHAMLEALDQMTPDRQPDARLHAMLLGALRTLAVDDHPLVVPAFFLKLLAHEGFRPVTDGCATCATPVDLCWFDLHEGGLLCDAHRRGSPVGPEAVDLLQLVLGGRLGEALSRPAGAPAREVELLATRAVEHHLERRLRSVGVLDRT